MRVGFFIFPGFQLLDLSGPLGAFEIAKRFHGAGNYELPVVSVEGGPIASSSGVALVSAAMDGHFDTLIVVGGDDMESVLADTAVIGCLRRAAINVRRMASICTGALLFAETGLLKGRKVTTHWRFAAELQRRHPDIQVDADRIFLRDGPYWSSAGITAGIDLALALIEDDCGMDVARNVARDLVVFHRRPGGQSQYSKLLEVSAQSERIAKVVSHARQHLAEPLSVEDLAAVARLSPRQFARIFREETGSTPARAIEQLRSEAARLRVEQNGSESLTEIAAMTGFGDLERMRRAFLRAFGKTPQALRRTAQARFNFENPALAAGARLWRKSTQAPRSAARL